MSRVMVIGDTHLPFTHKDYLRFCKKVHKKYKCNKVVHVGDLVDGHAWSYHEANPSGMSAGEELKAIRKSVKPWWRAFPKMTVCIGNHDKLPLRKAQTHGLPAEMFKDYNGIYGIEGKWDWVIGKDIDGVWYTHTGGGSGQTAHIKGMEKHRTNLVMGHVHSGAGIGFSTSYKDRLFGMNVGCGVDPLSYAQEYGKDFASRPVLSCGVVLEGIQPILIPMELE